MYKVVINECLGGFGLSKKAVRLAKKKAPSGSPWHEVEEEYGFLRVLVPRHDSILVEVVEELGSEANGRFAELKVVEIDEPLYFIKEHDGMETLHTPKSVEWIDASNLPKIKMNKGEA